MFLVIRIVVAIALAGWVMQQVRKPNGWLGRSVVRAMSMSRREIPRRATNGPSVGMTTGTETKAFRPRATGRWEMC